MVRLPGLFRTRSLVPYKNPIAADIIVFGIYSSEFLFYIDNVTIIVCCVYSLESHRRGHSDKHVLHTFMLEKLDKMSLLWLLSCRYD